MEIFFVILINLTKCNHDFVLERHFLLMLQSLLHYQVLHDLKNDDVFSFLLPFYFEEITFLVSPSRLLSDVSQCYLCPCP